jgi:NAD(P)-dependent dehydrogenase (short-subunit alcohol dehydrogenase family)
MDKPFKNKTAVVTGSTQGIGYELCKIYIEKGIDNLVIVGRDQNKGKKVEEEFKSKNINCVFVKADLNEVSDCKKIIKTADEFFKRVDILVNCAGDTRRGTILSTDKKLFDEIIAVNLRAPFFLMQEAIKIMRREKIKGAIASVITMSSHSGHVFKAPYSASKSGLVNLTKSVAWALARDNIKVNGLNLGWTHTPGEEKTMERYVTKDKNWPQTIGKNLPWGRLIQPIEAAKALAFMTSDESGLMTGSIIDFDQTISGWYADYDAPPKLLDTDLGI